MTLLAESLYEIDAVEQLAAGLRRPARVCPADADRKASGEA